MYLKLPAKKFYIYFSAITQKRSFFIVGFVVY